MVITALVLAGLAALVHVYIFYMESLAWTSPRVRATFGTSLEEAQSTKEMAFNQGFYNVFLAIGAGIGLVLLGTGASVEAGVALALFSLGSMLLAAIVLVTSSPKMLRGALLQGVPPALGILFLVLSLLVAWL